MTTTIPLAVLPESRTRSTKKRRPGFRPVGKKTRPSQSPTVVRNAAHKPSDEATTEEPLPQPKTIATPEAEHLNDESSQKEASADATSKARTSTRTSTRSPKEGSSETNKRSTPRKRKSSMGIAVSVSKRSRTTASQAMPSKKKSPSSKSVADSQGTAEAVETPKTSDPQKTPEVPPAPLDKETLDNFVKEGAGTPSLGTFCTPYKRPRPPKGKGSKKTDSKKKKGQKNSSTTPAPQTKDPEETPTSSGGAPAVQIVDGEIVLQESSLVFPGQRRSVQEVEAEFGQDGVVEEVAQLAIVGASYTSFTTKNAPRKGPHHWSVDETEQFYTALRQLGTDFGSMEAFFEGNRTRKQLKRKYQSEMSRHPALVEMALDPRNQLKIDLSVFDVVVDQKAIEAAKIDKPPPYEPTIDVNKQLESPASGEKDDSGGEGEPDLPPIIAEEESSTQQKNTRSNKEPKASVAARAAQRQLSFWESLPPETTTTEPEDFPEPSIMEHHDMMMFPNDNAEEMLAEKGPENTAKKTTGETATTAVGAQTSATAPPFDTTASAAQPLVSTRSTTPTTTNNQQEGSISLVPAQKSSVGKSKRPKFRKSISRKRK